MNKHRLLPEMGRSMVEMLGVLILIAVLTLGGIKGYQYAINRHKVNTTLHDVKMRAVIISQQLLSSGQLNEFEWNATTEMGYPVRVVVNPNDTFDILLDSVPSKVCQGLIDEKWTLPIDVTLKNNPDCGSDTYIDGLDFKFSTMLDPNATDEPIAPEPFKCASDSDCSSICGTCSNGTCKTKCTASQSCYAGACIKPACVQDADCASKPATPYCQIFSNPSRNACVARSCSHDSDCAGTKPYCLLSAGDDYGTCVECLKNEHCPFYYCAVGNEGHNTCQKPNVCEPYAVNMTQKYCEETCRMNWNGHTCCPDNLGSLTGADNCQQCEGIWAYDSCHPADFCQTDVFNKNTASKWLCNQCGGFYDSATKECAPSDCKTNSDCLSNEFCSVDDDTNYYYGNRRVCKKIADFNPINGHILFNDQKESWIISGKDIKYWDAINWCAAQGKSLQSRDVLQQRWIKLGTLGSSFQVYVYTSTSAGADKNYIMNLASGYSYPVQRNDSNNKKALCH